MNENTVDLSQFAQGNLQEVKSVCPSCGYCPHCGRGGHQTYPWVPAPSYPWTITWTYPQTTSSSGAMNLKDKYEYLTGLSLNQETK